jgi:hypothetical protein
LLAHVSAYSLADRYVHPLDPWGYLLTSSLIALLAHVSAYVLADRYVHPLDPWGNAMLGEETASTQCFFGNSGLHASPPDAAFKYCSRVYGYTGPTVIAAQSGIRVPGGPVGDVTQLKNDFALCKYYTHLAQSMYVHLQMPGVLHANGSTDGGCTTTPLIPEGDAQGECPTGAQAAGS